MPHSHLDLFADEPGWLEETRVDLVPVGSLFVPLEDDEPTGIVVVVEALEPGHTIVCAAPPPPVRTAEGSGLLRIVDEPRFSCGMTRHEHDEIKLDVIRREVELEYVGEIHDEDIGVHLRLANHSCGSTLAYPLPGHHEDAP